MRQTCERYHDISCGHRVVGHEGKCRHLHGHNYRVHFVCEADSLDAVGRVIDFGVIKQRLCMWLEDNWDHKFIAWHDDPVVQAIYYDLAGKLAFQDAFDLQKGIVRVHFNPTAENLATYLLETVGPEQLAETGVRLVSVRIEETAKCSASAHKD